MINRGVHPLVPEQGSVGASGDLAPLAHLASVLIGEGEAIFQGKAMPGRKAMEKAGIPVLTLKAKEGLSLINGTQVMTAVGLLSLLRAERLCKIADIVGACTLDALKGIAERPLIRISRGSVPFQVNWRFQRTFRDWARRMRSSNPTDSVPRYRMPIPSGASLRFTAR